MATMWNVAYLTNHPFVISYLQNSQADKFNGAAKYLSIIFKSISKTENIKAACISGSTYTYFTSN